VVSAQASVLITSRLHACVSRGGVCVLQSVKVAGVVLQRVASQSEKVTCMLWLGPNQGMHRLCRCSGRIQA
jgi:hypothetical protein